MATAVLSGRAEAQYGDAPQPLVDDGTDPRGGSHTSPLKQIVGTDTATSGRGRDALADGEARLVSRSTPAARSYRACVRAMLALRHLDDAAPLRDKWLSRARAYLALAGRADSSLA